RSGSGNDPLETASGRKENYGTRIKRSTPPHAGDEWKRPPHHHQLSAPNPGARPSGAARPAPVDARRDQATGLQRDDRFAEAPFRRKPRTGLLLRFEGAGSLPRQRLQPARRFGLRLPSDSVRDQVVSPAGPASGGQQDVRQAAWAGAGDR